MRAIESQRNQTKPQQKSESHPRKIQCVKRNDAGNAAAGADARCLRTGIKSDMRQVADEYCQCNERQITQWPQKISPGSWKLSIKSGLWRTHSLCCRPLIASIEASRIYHAAARW